MTLSMRLNGPQLCGRIGKRCRYRAVDVVEIPAGERLTAMGRGDVGTDIAPTRIGVRSNAIRPGGVETLDEAFDHRRGQRLLTVEVIEHSALSDIRLFGDAIEGQAEHPLVRDDFFRGVKQPLLIG